MTVALIWALASSPAVGQDEAKPPADPPIDAAKAVEPSAAGKLAEPAAIPDVKLGPVLETFAVPRGQAPGPNEVVIDSSKLPRDKQGIWVLDFMFKPVRMRTVDVPGKGRKNVMYLWYRVINRTGESRLFAPQLTLVTDTGKTYHDTVVPSAIKIIETRETSVRNAGYKLKGAVDAIGMIPASAKPNVDDAVYGVAIWQDVDPKADSFKVYVRGLSDGYRSIAAPKADAEAKPTIQHKTLQINFECRGDEFNETEDEIHLLDPAYEWIYWAPGK